jgi:hypothetical protein
MSNVKSSQFKDILEAAINSNGEIALPNSVLIEDPAEALRLISSGQYYENNTYKMRLREFDPPLDGRQTHEVGWYPKIFTNHVGMGAGFSGFDGSGVVLCSGKVYKFSMCQHDWDESGANHSRGWHPKRCRKCGVDASIDSGD